MLFGKPVFQRKSIILLLVWKINQIMLCISSKQLNFKNIIKMYLSLENYCVIALIFTIDKVKWWLFIADMPLNRNMLVYWQLTKFELAAQLPANPKPSLSTDMDFDINFLGNEGTNMINQILATETPCSISRMLKHTVKYLKSTTLFTKYISWKDFQVSRWHLWKQRETLSITDFIFNFVKLD